MFHNLGQFMLNYGHVIVICWPYDDKNAKDVIIAQSASYMRILGRILFVFFYKRGTIFY